ncbi:PiggyBac transposable element-derived protein 4 [Trichinella sp. T8]|nr:PiggyBac transposable element-derived protein 4 [Trichinella sp. T8]
MNIESAVCFKYAPVTSAECLKIRALLISHCSAGRSVIDPRARRSLMIGWGSGSKPLCNEPLIYRRAASRGTTEWDLLSFRSESGDDVETSSTSKGVFRGCRRGDETERARTNKHTATANELARTWRQIRWSHPAAGCYSYYLKQEEHLIASTSTSVPSATQTRSHNAVRQMSAVLRTTASGIQCPGDALKLLITFAMVNLIVQNTNKIENVRREWNEKHPDAMKSWKPTDEKEIYAFIGLLLISGVFKSSDESVSDLWSLNNGRPIFQTPSAFLTVDEQLVSTRARSSLRQYMPCKPGKYGIKILWCCDAETSYPLAGEICAGKQPGKTGRMNVANLGKRSVRPWCGKGRNITMDNFFTSIPLAEDLLVEKTTIVGTLRRNKKEVPSEIIQAKS